jgi:exosortase E/protease (VPEID-CTERM system)
VHVLVWTALLFLESEFLAVRNYELRTEIRALLHIPLYHLTFSFLAFAFFLYRLQARRLGSLQLGPLRWRWASLHLALFGVLALTLHPLARALRPFPVLWLVVLLIFATSWAAALLPPARWPDWFKAHGPWLGMALVLGALSLGIMHVSNWLWRPLAGGTLALAELLLRGIYEDVHVVQAKYQIGTSVFSILIEPGCSGYEGIGLVTLFSLTYLWLRRSELSFPLALLLLPLGWVMNWIINGLRIAALVVLGTGFSPDLAMKGFHSQAGWLAFIATSTFLVLLVEHSGWFHPCAPHSAEDSDSDLGEEEPNYPAAPYLLPLLALLLGTILGSAFSTGFPLLYPLRILLACLALALWKPTGLGPFVRLRALLTGGAVYVMWALLVPGQPAQSIWGLVSPALAWTWIAFRVVGSSLIVPLAEELAFRGYLMRRLQDANFDAVPPEQIRWPAWLLSSLAFGLLHQDWLAATLAGLAYGQLWRRGGSLGEVVTAHALTNFCICLQVLGLGHWSLW